MKRSTRSPTASRITTSGRPRPTGSRRIARWLSGSAPPWPTPSASLRLRGIAASKPSLPLARYAGTYTDAWYGDISIEEKAGKLVMRFTRTPSLVGDLEHWQHDTFIARWRDRELRADAYITFALNPDGTIDQAKMRAVSDDHGLQLRFPRSAAETSDEAVVRTAQTQPRGAPAGLCLAPAAGAFYANVARAPYRRGRRDR